MCTLKTKIGPIVSSIEFHIIDIPASFNLLLGRPQLYKMNAIASTLHQKVRMPWKDVILTLNAEKEVEAPVYEVEKSDKEMSLGGFKTMTLITKDDPDNSDSDSYIDQSSIYNPYNHEE